MVCDARISASRRCFGLRKLDLEAKMLDNLILFSLMLSRKAREDMGDGKEEKENSP